ncbi:S-adenosyl-l-methionine hydroxide adenosyltransferase family protein [Flavobacterium sp. RHBU_3]|uniref:SAM hydrolase/SAM-dependent halogenase family protein n=1 Tax=Flavobacterium sp. RHBU_3 TaxID=3391184 RepID=UPI00398477C0
MSIITLTTDFGLCDHFVGALKGKLISGCSDAVIIDISHNVDLFNIPQAGYIISAAWRNFPVGTVHLIGVDAELSPENRHIAILWNGHYFVCADNGILSLLTQSVLPEKIVEINIHDRLPEGSNAMDVFATVACHLAKGGTLSVIGRETTAPLKPMHEMNPVVATDKNSIRGNVVYIDHFGNCVTNISRKLLKEIGKGRNVEINFGTKGEIKGIKSGYSDFNLNERFSLKDYEGEKLAVFNEAGFLEIAIFRSNPHTVGSAKTLLGLKYRDMVSVKFE